jgi:NAD(P)-dependent dehydrogenase (short-subunit alcohol dehydrogenase family)
VVSTPLFERGPYTESEASAWHPLGRVGLPRDVADCAVWLLSDEASWMTGTSVVLDGGMLL